MLAAMIHAHLLNIDDPGCYDEELSKTLKLNNLPSIKLPNNNPPSTEILSVPQKDEESYENQEETVNQNMKENISEEIARTQKQPQPQITEEYNIEDKNTGLQIPPKKYKGWPEGQSYTERGNRRPGKTHVQMDRHR